MTPSELAVDVQVADEQEVHAAVEAILSEVGLTLIALADEGKSGSFSSDATRMAWWAVSPFVDVES